MGIEVTADEQDRRVKGMREERARIARENPNHAAEEIAIRGLDLDRLGIKNPDPKKRYRWANRVFRDGERVTELEGLGYEIVPENDPAKANVAVKKAGGQVQGTMVLMQTSAENYERRRALRRMKHEAMVAGGNLEAIEKINKIARDGKLAPPHKDITFDESREEEPFQVREG